jgi:signal peptidase II
MKPLLATAVAVICFVLDRISKNWAKQYLQAAVHKTFLPGLLRLVLVTNTGGAFGVASGNNTALAVISGSIMLGVIIWAVRGGKSRHGLNTIQWCGIGFLIGGAFGNLWDRLTLGHVIDFLDFAFIDFPVFNLSDIFVDIGIGLIALGCLRVPKKATSYLKDRHSF